MLDYAMDVQEALDGPRGLHYEGIYNLEHGVFDEIADGLKKIGHVIGRPVSPWGGAQAI